MELLETNLCVSFFNTASGVCQSLRVQLFNNAFEAQWERQGIYHISALVNGQPSWTTPYSGIWYMPELRRWKIGPIESIGLNCEGLESVELGNKLYYPEHIHCKDWNYHTMDGWVPANEHNYILVEKRGKNILDHLDMPSICNSRRNRSYLFQTVVSNHCGCTPRGVRGVKRPEFL